jgi:tetratricopeptide (TPR) repeat protein
MAKKLLLMVAAAALVLALVGCEDDEFTTKSQADWTNEGWAAWRDADYPLAITSFGNATKADPYYAEAHAGIGWTYLRTHSLGDAAEVFEDAILYADQPGTKEQVRQVIYMGAATAYEGMDEYALSAARGRYMINNLNGAKFEFEQAVPEGVDPTITGYDLYIVLALDYYGLGNADNCVWAINKMRGMVGESTNYRFSNWRNTTLEIERLIGKDPS